MRGCWQWTSTTRTTRPFVNENAHPTPLLFGIYQNAQVRYSHFGNASRFCVSLSTRTDHSLGLNMFTGAGLCNPEKRMLELHKIESCSKSPTLPSEDEWSFTSYIVIYISLLWWSKIRGDTSSIEVAASHRLYKTFLLLFFTYSAMYFRWQCQKSEESWSFA